MNLHYVKLNPTGNITLLVTTPVPRALQPGISARLLAPECVGGEQVGFIEPPTDPKIPARLQMMGGEFCGNATMSLGALLARGAALPDGDHADFRLEISGAEGPVPCRIRREGDAWVGTVDMPRPSRIEEIELPTDAGTIAVPIVEMPGIAHLILPAAIAPGEAELRRRLPEWNRTIGADALGALVWDEAEGAIDPLVYVPSAGTLVREHGCGSGSAAVGCWLASKASRAVEVPVRQPGGVITVCAGPDALTITGRVTLDAEGDVEI